VSIPDSRRFVILQFGLGLISASATALEPGELVKDGYFTLFESVGALEACYVSA
jgi:hypothetical protein